MCIYIYIPPYPTGPVHWMHPTYYTSSAWLTFCTTNSALWGVLIAAGTCQMPMALSYPAAMTTDVSRHCPVSMGDKTAFGQEPLLIFQLGCSFFFLILSCMSCLYILEISLLSVASFANVFSQSEGCLCVSFMAFFFFFCCAKAFKFNQAHIFVFIFRTVEGGSKKILL